VKCFSSTKIKIKSALFQLANVQLANVQLANVQLANVQLAKKTMKIKNKIVLKWCRKIKIFATKSQKN